MRTRRLVLIAVLASAPLLAACGTGPTAPADGTAPTCNVATSTHCTSSQKKEQSPWN